MRTPAAITAAVLVALAASLPAAIAKGTTHLGIDVWPHGRTIATGHRHYTVRCSPPAGTVPHPAIACAALAGLSRPFAPTPRGTVCPSLVLGPQEAHVEGIVKGARVDAWLNLAHCGVTRWDRVKAIVPEPKLAQPPPPASP